MEGDDGLDECLTICPDAWAGVLWLLWMFMLEIDAVRQFNNVGGKVRGLDGITNLEIIATWSENVEDGVI